MMMVVTRREMVGQAFDTYIVPALPQRPDPVFINVRQHPDLFSLFSRTTYWWGDSGFCGASVEQLGFGIDAHNEIGFARNVMIDLTLLLHCITILEIHLKRTEIH